MIGTPVQTAALLDRHDSNVYIEFEWRHQGIGAGGILKLKRRRQESVGAVLLGHRDGRTNMPPRRDYTAVERVF